MTLKSVIERAGEPATDGVYLVHLVAAVVALHGGEGGGQRGVVGTAGEGVGPAHGLVVLGRGHVLRVVGLLDE